MLKRLGVGLLKGLLVGGAVGAAIQMGAGWHDTQGLLGFLLAMGTGSTAGILCGTPPWQSEAWIESILKGLFGLGIGALLYWLGSSFAAVGVPIALAGSEAGTAWTGVPLLYAPAIGGVWGALVELDNTGEGESGGGGETGGKRKTKRSSRTRVDGIDGLDDEAAPPAGAKKRRRAGP